MNKRIVLLCLACLLALALPAFAQRPAEHLLHSAEATNATGLQPTVTGFTSATVQVVVAGGFDGTLTWGTSTDGTNYVGVLCRNQASGAMAATATASGIYVCPIPGADRFQAPITNRTAGNVTVTAQFAGPGVSSEAGSVSMSTPPAAASCKTQTVNSQGVAGATVTVDATVGGITVLAASTTRCGGLVQLESGGDVRCTWGATAPTTTVGFLLEVGKVHTFSLAGQTQMRCLRVTATSGVVSTVEETP